MPRPPLPSNIVCYHCQSKDTSKAGFNRGKQRYYCRACRRWFRENPVVPNGGKINEGRQSKNLPSKGHLILSLQAISQRLGRTPTTTDINELSKAGRSYPLNNYYDVFGSFTEALKKASLKANYKQKFDKEKLLGTARTSRKTETTAPRQRCRCRSKKRQSFFRLSFSAHLRLGSESD
jgi:hypothetical protein